MSTSMTASTASVQTEPTPDPEQQMTSASETIHSSNGIEGSESGVSMTEGSISGVGESWASEFTSSVDVTPDSAVCELPQSEELQDRLVTVRLVS